MSVFTKNRYCGSFGLFGLALVLIALVAAPLTGEQERFVLTRKQRDSMSKETLMALHHIQNFHYTKKPIAEIDSEELIASFMKELDYNRLFFLQSDHDELFLRFGATLKGVYLGRGDLYPAFQMFEIYRERAMQRLDWVFENLRNDFDFSVDQTFTPDRSEMPWPIDQVEADSLWEKRLKFDLLQEMLNDQTLDQAREKIERRYRRSQRYIEEIEPKDIQELFITSLANMYDPHSTFLSSDTMENFNITMRKSLGGIGALLRDEDGYCVIQKLLAGGPAEQSGQLHPGDRIIEVSQAGKNPVDVIDMRLSKIVKLIRGKKGTEVRLTVIPAASDPSERKLITLQRDVVKLTETLASAEIHDVPWGESMTVAIGVIELTSFYGPVTGKKEALSTTHDLEELILKLKDMNIQGLILDLRRNGGGFLNEAITTTGLFIPKGPVVQVKDATGRVRENWDRDPAIVYDGPLIVLVSRRSASASEIVAGALQNHRRALIVGDTATHGKGTVQKVFELDRSQFFNREANQSKFGATKITTQKFYLPNGESTQKEGVRSDIVIPSINDHLPIGESDLPNALIWDSIAPLNWDDFQDTFKKNGSLIEEGLIESLRNDSLQRQDTLEEFSYLKRNIDWFKERQERKQISLNFEIRSQQKKEDTTFREEMETIKNDLLSMDEFPFRKVLLELSLEKKTEHQSKLKQSLLPNGKSKANNYYQKVFYFQPEGADEIKEVWVEQFDYEKAFKQSEAVAHFLSEKSGRRLDTESVENLFRYLKNADPDPEFRMEKVFQDFLGDNLNEEQIDALLPHFFTKLIEIDPDVLKDRSGLDIPLRESLRILADWVQYRGKSSESAALVSPQQKKG